MSSQNRKKASKQGERQRTDPVGTQKGSEPARHWREQMGGLRRLRVMTQVKSTVIGTATFPRIGPVNRVTKWPASACRAGSEPSHGNTSLGSGDGRFCQRKFQNLVVGR